MAHYVQPYGYEVTHKQFLAQDESNELTGSGAKDMAAGHCQVDKQRGNFGPGRGPVHISRRFNFIERMTSCWTSEDIAGHRRTLQHFAGQRRTPTRQAKTNIGPHNWVRLAAQISPARSRGGDAHWTMTNPFRKLWKTQQMGNTAHMWGGWPWRGSAFHKPLPLNLNMFQCTKLN